MATTTKKLFNPALISLVAKAYYQTPDPSISTVLKSVTLHNTTSLPVLVTVYLVPSGDEPSALNEIFSRAIAGKDSIKVTSAINEVLEAGDTLNAIASTDGAVAIHGSGIEIS